MGWPTQAVCVNGRSIRKWTPGTRGGGLLLASRLVVRRRGAGPLELTKRPPTRNVLVAFFSEQDVPNSRAYAKSAEFASRYRSGV